jgi:hypothetical protein
MSVRSAIDPAERATHERATGMANRNWIFLAGVTVGAAVAAWLLARPVYSVAAPLITLDNDTLIALQGIDPEALDAFIAEEKAKESGEAGRVSG